MELIIKLTFSPDWSIAEEERTEPELIAEDAIRELAEGVGYEVLEFIPTKKDDAA